ncbi:MAG TPA: hypothetical protein EYP10_01215, partial [Armatimonadetes bacterium]|nr:hypothetical protein [Armatimonadota bacterium]
MSIYQWVSLITIASAPRFAVRQEGNAPTSAFLTIIASAFIILLNAQILCAPVASWKFDFGAPQEVAVVESGWTSVSADTAYSDERGYGWVDTRELQYRDRGFPDKLRRDFVFSRAPQREFRVRVPNGDYRIMLIAGDSLAADHYLTIIAEGMEVIRDINTRRCEYAEITFDVIVRDGMLNIVFASPQHRNWVVNALALEPLGKRKRLKKPMVRKRRFEDPITALRRKMMVPAKNVSALRVIKPPRWDEPSYPWLEDYMRVLERFPLYAERGWHPVKVGDEQLGYFGDIDHAEMGMRAMGNFILVYALLATDPSYDPKPSGIPREVVLEHALQCLRYMCRTHITGDLVRPTGRKWGNHWQSAWWASKMATGAQLLWDILTAEDKALIERVISYEADRHLKRRAPSGEHRDTKSEENAWDAEVLAWACALFPNHPH